jgi:dihydroflavonol-4-reductase
VITLVSGANGHVGSHVVRALLKRGRPVRALVRKSSNLASLLGLDVEPAFGDVLDKESLKVALKGVSRVFHCAAMFKTRGVDEALMRRTNVEGTRNMLEACAEAGGIERLVYTSSVAAVGCRRQPGQLMSEADWNSAPIDAYVASKTDSERLALALAKASGLPVVFVNPATVLGPGDYGPTPSNGFVLLCMKKTPPFYFDSGHSYVDVEDVAEGHLLAEEKGRVLERYILSGENCSNLDLMTRCTGGRPPRFKIGHLFVEGVGLLLEAKARLLGGVPLFTRQKAHQLIDYYGYFDGSKARRELGFQARPLDEILPRCKQWFEARGWLGV